ncbi:uncharacterized protein LOC116769811 [Danaus plexippus]|uniref:uncharacterized protein LOC116769811 n=1 Tax=Danaus plexippus TaxID=13037 RepID=UPI002AAF4D4D|nr:uncharacterized protein LOC116769811 [Danaus plexippus]
MRNKDHEKAVSNIVQCLGLPRKVESFFGIIKYRMIDGQLVEPNIAMKSYGILIPVFIVFGWTIIILDTWFDIQLNIFFNSHLDSTDYLDRLPMVVTVVQSCLSLVVFLRNSKNNIKIINSFAYTDCLLKLHNNRGFHEKIQKTNRFAICIFLLILISSIVQNNIENQSAIIYNTIEALIDFKFHFETLSFYFYLKMVSRRIDVLNKHLDHFVKKRDNIRPIVISKENLEVNKVGDYIGRINHQNTKITSLAFAYETLGESLLLLNNMCSTNIFLYLASNFINIIISLWSFVHFIRTKNHLSSLPGIIFESTVEISVVIIMCYVCEELTMKRRSTRILVNEIVMDYKLPNEMRIQAKSFFDLIEVWPLQVYASRMFCMNIQLLLGFVSVSSTYLIFIIQATK